LKRANGLIEYELIEHERWETKTELIGLTTAWEYYFNRLMPNSYQQNRLPHQRMKHAGIQSRIAENACLWTVTILDGKIYKQQPLNSCATGYNVCNFDGKSENNTEITALKLLNLVGGNMKKQMLQAVIFGLILVFTFSGCATFRSNIEGVFVEDTTKNYGTEKISVVFVVSHFQQAKGFDAIPKLEKKYQTLSGFGDILKDATREFSNLEKYASFTEFSSDISEPKRMALKDSLLATHDFSIEIEIRKEWSFAKHFLGTLGSVFSATLLPIVYSKDFSMTADVFDSDGKLIKGYSRSATTTKLVEALLLPIYPFHTERRKTEEIYVEILHDIFRQIESEKILTKEEN